MNKKEAEEVKAWIEILFPEEEVIIVKSLTHMHLRLKKLNYYIQTYKQASGFVYGVCVSRTRKE